MSLWPSGLKPSVCLSSAGLRSSRNTHDGADLGSNVPSRYSWPQLSYVALVLFLLDFSFWISSILSSFPPISCSFTLFHFSIYIYISHPSLSFSLSSLSHPCLLSLSFHFSYSLSLFSLGALPLLTCAANGLRRQLTPQDLQHLRSGPRDPAGRPGEQTFAINLSVSHALFQRSLLKSRLAHSLSASLCLSSFHL